MIVSGKPPLLLIITAHPLLAASRLVLPNGSFHLEQTTAMEDFWSFFKTILCFWKPKFFKRSCSIIIFSLGSSPITKEFHSGYLSRIFVITSPNKSYPLALFNFPTNIIVFSFWPIFTLTLLVDCSTTISFSDLEYLALRFFRNLFFWPLAIKYYFF